MPSSTGSTPQDSHPRDEAKSERDDNDQTRRTLERSAGPDPQQPHERDESADTAAEPQPRIEQAHEDLKRGLQDTDRGKPMDDTYRKQQ